MPGTGDDGPSEGGDTTASTTDTTISSADSATFEEPVTPWYRATSTSSVVIGAVEQPQPAAPPPQRYTDEDLADCDVEECVTKQFDEGRPVAGSFEESTIGTHYFKLEPKLLAGGEPGWATIKLRKFMTDTSVVLGEVDHLVIVTLLDEAIGPDCKWCKVRIQDLERNVDLYNVIGYVRRQHLHRLEYGDKCWEGSTTLPSPKYNNHKQRKKRNWSLGSPWYSMLACEPWLDKKRLKYKTMVNTGHKNFEVRDMLNETAIEIGIKQMLVYYDRCPKGYDVRTLDNAVAYLQDNLYRFAKVEKTFLDARPGSSVKALISINMAHLLALPRMIRSYSTTTQMQTGYRTVMYQSNTIEKKLKKVADTMDKIQMYVDMFPGTIRGSNRFSAKKQASRIRKFMPALKGLMQKNGQPLRPDHEDVIEIGTDGAFNPVHCIVYPDDTGIGMPQNIGFNQFGANEPASLPRLMHYILQGNNMFSDAKLPEWQSLSPPWMSYLTDYTFPPLMILPTPPSGLGNIPNLGDLGNIANQFNALPIKGPGDIDFENLKLGDPAFLANMALARVDINIPSGDNIIANLPDVLDKIHSLDDVFAELLQKISIPKLIAAAMAKLMAELGLDNIYAAMLKAALGQFSVDALIKQFLMQLPDDIFAELLDQLFDSLDVSCEELIQLIVGMGIQFNHLQGIVDMVGDQMESLQDKLDEFNSLLPELCADTTDAEVDTSLDEDLAETEESVQASIEDMLANLTCEELKLLVKNVAFGGVPSFSFEPPTIDLSCYVKDLELMIGTFLMPFMVPLSGFPIDITRLGEIDWSLLKPEAPNLNIRLPTGEFINISDWDVGGLELGNIPGFPAIPGGPNLAVCAPDLNFPQFASPDLSLSPGGIQMPNIKFAEAFSDIEFPGGIEVLLEAIGALPTGALPGLSLADLNPDIPGASLPDAALADLKFGEFLDDWRRIFLEAMSGFLLGNFPLAIAGGGGAFTKFRAKMEGFDWGSDASIVIPEAPDAAIPNSTLPNIPAWNPSGVQVPLEGVECTLDASVSEVTGIGWQTLATMPQEWWERTTEGSDAAAVMEVPDFAAMIEYLQRYYDEESEDVGDVIDALKDLVDTDFTSVAEWCEIIDKIDALMDALNELNGPDPIEGGRIGLDAGYEINIADIILPTAVFRPEVGCGIIKLYGLPDFGYGGMKFPIPIAGPNGDETFDIFDMPNLLENLPKIPNFPDILPPGVTADNLALLCDMPEFFEKLFDLMFGDLPTVQGALGTIDAWARGLTNIDMIPGGEVGGIDGKKIMIALFKFIIDKLGLSPLIDQLADILKLAMSAGDLTPEMIAEIPAIQIKIDKLMAAIPSMPQLSVPSLDGFGGMPGGGGGGGGFGGFGGGGGSSTGGGGGGPSIEAPSTALPGGGMPGGAPGSSGGGLSGGSVASMAEKFEIPTITLPDNIPTGDLMGAMFSGMQDAVKSAIEQALVEMGKSVLRSLLQEAADGGFGDADILDMLSNSLGNLDLAIDAINAAFAEMGVDENGMLITTTTTTVEVTMGCGEPWVPPDPEEEPPCTPVELVGKISKKLNRHETGSLLGGMMAPSTCSHLEEVIRDGCPWMAQVFDDCSKLADTFEVIGEKIKPQILEEIQDPMHIQIRDLSVLCCNAEPFWRDEYIKRHQDNGGSLEDACAAADEVEQEKQDSLEGLALMAMDPFDPLSGDGHGGTIVPDVWPQKNCEEQCPTEDPPKPSLFPIDSEIPTLNYMNEMATNLMFEPINLMFKMESDQYPEMLVSGTVLSEAIPFWEAAGTHMAGGDAGISRFAESLFNNGAPLCDENGVPFGTDSYKSKLNIVRSLANIGGGSGDDTNPTGTDWSDLKGDDIHVLQQRNSSSVAPVLYNSLRRFDYLKNTWDTEIDLFSWDFQYGGDSETPTGDAWPTVTWALAPMTQEDADKRNPKAVTTTTIPSTITTPLGKDCDPPEEIEAIEETSPAGVDWEAGLPVHYQLFRQFVRDKFIKHPNLSEGIDVQNLAAWTDIGFDNKGANMGFGFKSVYQQIINQIIQSAGIQIIFTDLFDTETLKLVEIEPSSLSPVDSCGEKPKSVLDLEETGKKLTKDAFMQACVDPIREQETGKNALKQAGLVGCIEVTVRVYVIDALLRSIFPLSEYDVKGFDTVFLQQVYDKINREMNLLDPTYASAFLEETQTLFESQCEAAKCKDEPLTDPVTGEEITDCSGMDSLMYYIKKHLFTVADILNEKFGTTTPNLSARMQNDWLTVLDIPEYPIPDDMDVSGMLSQADLLTTLLMNPRPEAAVDGMQTYYSVPVTGTGTGTGGTGTPPADPPADTLSWVALDITSVNPGERIRPGLPDNIPLPRLFDFTATDFSSTELTYVDGVYTVLDPETGLPMVDDAGLPTGDTIDLESQWRQINPAEAPTVLFGSNTGNNTYYNLTKNWSYPSNATNPTPETHIATTEVQGGLYLEKFIKVGQEYWHPANFQEFLERLIAAVSREDPDILAIAALTAYSITEAHYGLRLCYMYPTNRKDGDNLVAPSGDTPSITSLLIAMFGTTGDMSIPDVTRMQGSLLQLEGVNFNVEVDTEIPMPSTTATEDSEASSEADSETALEEEAEDETSMVSATAIETQQHRYYNVSIPLVETLISAGNPITAAIDEAFGETFDAADAAMECEPWDLECLERAGRAAASAVGGLEDMAVAYRAAATASPPDYEAIAAMVASYQTPWTSAVTALDGKLKDLQKQLRKEKDWKFLFKKCFRQNDIVTNLWNYCAMMTEMSVPGIDMSFAATKEECRNLFWTLYHDIGTGGDGFSFDASAQATSMEVASVNVDSDGGGLPLPIKMCLMTIPLLFKGICETIDPNIMIAKLIRVAADGDQGAIKKFPSTLMALPFNLIPPPPFGPGIGPPITPLGLAYLALGAFTPMEKQKMRMGKSGMIVPAPPSGTGEDADCNPAEGEADE
jgi:hypothetical protein